MSTDDQFGRSYEDLEERMKALAAADGDIYLPNIAPKGPVDYILIGMEPSLGRWARNAEQADARLNEGVRNFLPAGNVCILRHCIQHYLCAPSERYHITDISKGAMLVQHAMADRDARYDRWGDLLLEEIQLVGKESVTLVAIGGAVASFLTRRKWSLPFASIIHYSDLAASARKKAVVGREEEFRAFSASVSHQDLVETSKAVLAAAEVPQAIRDETLAKLARMKLTTSRLQLLFSYKVAFEQLRIQKGSEDD